MFQVASFKANRRSECCHSVTTRCQRNARVHRRDVPTRAGGRLRARARAAGTASSRAEARPSSSGSRRPGRARPQAGPRRAAAARLRAAPLRGNAARRRFRVAGFVEHRRPARLVEALGDELVAQLQHGRLLLAGELLQLLRALGVLDVDGRERNAAPVEEALGVLAHGAAGERVERDRKALRRLRRGERDGVVLDEVGRQALRLDVLRIRRRRAIRIDDLAVLVDVAVHLLLRRGAGRDHGGGDAEKERNSPGAGFACHGFSFESLRGSLARMYSSSCHYAAEARRVGARGRETPRTTPWRRGCRRERAPRRGSALRRPATARRPPRRR